MSTTTPSYQLLDITHGNVDISPKVVSISPCTDVGTGELPMLIVKLDAKNGQFITQSNGGTTPIIDQFTVFKVTFTDINGISFIKGYVVDTLKQIENIQEGDRLEITAYGLEYWLQRVEFAKQFYFADAFSTFADIADIYNQNTGSSQPQIINQRLTAFNQLPNWTANHYLFNYSESSTYAAESEIVDKLGTTTVNGGAGDFFEMKFMNGDVSLPGYPTTILNFGQLTPITFVSGAPPIVKVDERAVSTAPLTIFQVNDWISGVAYSIGDFVRFNNRIYTSNINNNVSTPPVNWSLRTEYTYLNQGLLRVTEIDGETDAAQGTLIKAWGDDQSGSLPVQFSQFRGIDEAFFFFKDWVSGQSYPLNAFVFFTSGTTRNLYKSLQGNNTQPPNNLLFWQPITESDLLNQYNVRYYSPWTGSGNPDASALAAWQNCFANPDATNYAGLPSTFALKQAFDSNIVIQDGTFYRTWADIRAVSDVQIPNTMKIQDSNNAFHYYRGFRVLLDTNLGALGTPFTGNPAGNFDRFGNPLANSLVMNNGNGTGTWQDWDCFITNASPKGKALQLQTNWSISSWREGKNFRWTGVTWVDNSTVDRGNDCFHQYATIRNAPGVSNVPKTGGGTYGDTAYRDILGTAFGSAIEVTYTWNALTTLPSILFPFGSFIFNQPFYYQQGWWADIRFPFPVSMITANVPVGYFYGGYRNATQTNAGNQEVLEPATLDRLNMGYTPSGNVGFNQVDSESLASLSGIHFYMKMRYQGADGTLLTIPTGTLANFRMACYIFDIYDNVVVSNFVIQQNNVWQDISLPFDSFQIYRARIPLVFGDLQELTPPPNLNILNVFWWTQIKHIVIQLQNVYDDYGRYIPETSDLNLAAQVSSAWKSGLQLQLIGTIDSFRFDKPLLCTSNPLNTNSSSPYGNVVPITTGNVIEPEPMQRKNNTNYFQLKEDAQSMLEIYQFRRREYEVTTNLNCFIRFGDTFYLRSPKVVETQSPPDVAPDGLSANTIKLVAKKISYYLNKTDGGPGGLITTIRGVKRFPV